MLNITPVNYNKALNVLVNSFKENPGALIVLKKDSHIQDRLKVLCKYCLSVAISKQGAYITDDEKGVALLFNSNVKQNFVKSIIGYFILGNNCIGWNRAYGVIKRESYITGKRSGSPHLYFWMLGISDNENGLKTIIEVRDFAFNYSKSVQLPIYAETSVERNLKLYMRYGFEVYHEWNDDKNSIKTWFIRRDWNA